MSWFVVAPVNSGWLPASCKRTGRDPGWSARREKEGRGGREKSGTRVSIIVIPVRYMCVCVCGCARADRRYAYTVRSRVWCVFAWVAACEQNFSKTIPGPGRESIFGRWCGVKRGMGMGMAVAGWRGI